jgi:hypothetical protein
VRHDATTGPSECCGRNSESGNLTLTRARAGRGKGRDGERREVEKRKGRDYKDDKICDFGGATTEESYSKGIESIVFHQLIFFRESVHWYGSR